VSIEVSWDNDEQTILRYKFTGQWEWDEYLTCLSLGRNMMLSLDHYVCILNDFTESAFLPQGVISKVLNVMGTRPINTGMGIFMTTNATIEGFIGTLKNLYPPLETQYRLAKTEAEAYDIMNTWLAENTYKQD
jgi:hypothetical protein